jgi:hypothetical protein
MMRKNKELRRRKGREKEFMIPGKHGLKHPRGRNVLKQNEQRLSILGDNMSSGKKHPWDETTRDKTSRGTKTSLGTKRPQTKCPFFLFSITYYYEQKHRSICVYRSKHI